MQLSLIVMVCDDSVALQLLLLWASKIRPLLLPYMCAYSSVPPNLQPRKKRNTCFFESSSPIRTAYCTWIPGCIPEILSGESAVHVPFGSIAMESGRFIDDLPIEH